jgi:hypothetical protein
VPQKKTQEPSEELTQLLLNYFKNLDSENEGRTSWIHYRDQRVMAENKLRIIIGLPIVSGR